MKTYIQPQNRIIDFFEEDNILNSSKPNEEVHGIQRNYAEEDALSNKKNIWNTNNWLSD